MSASRQPVNPVQATAAKVRQRSVNWSDYANAEFLTRDQMQLLQDYDKAPQADQDALLETDGEDYAEMFTLALTSVSSDAVIEYLLTLIDDLLHAAPGRAQHFLTLSVDVFKPLLSLLGRAGCSSYTYIKASQILARFFAAQASPKPDVLLEFITYLTTKLDNAADFEVVETLVALRTVLKKRGAQDLFLQHHTSGLRTLATLLESNLASNGQVVYNSVFCIWLLSFGSPSDVECLSSLDILPNLVKALSSGMREKVVRMSLQVFQSLLGKGDFNELMIDAGLYKALFVLADKKFGDDDVHPLIEFMQEALKRDVRILSSFERYAKELSSGKLKWGPTHTEQFWKENINYFTDSEYEHIKLLIALLDSSDAVTVAVACYDLGEFVRFFQLGKKVLTRLHGKAQLMNKMAHPDAGVQKHALLAVQKLLVNNWEFIRGGE